MNGQLLYQGFQYTGNRKKLMEERVMKAMVDRKACNGCTMCNIICPEIFSLEDDCKAVAAQPTVPKGIEDICQEAAEECRVQAIILHK
jgi:ferredoxin